MDKNSRVKVKLPFEELVRKAVRDKEPVHKPKEPCLVSAKLAELKGDGEMIDIKADDTFNAYVIKSSKSKSLAGIECAGNLTLSSPYVVLAIGRGVIRAKNHNGKELTLREDRFRFEKIAPRYYKSEYGP